jgi:hypothetical protein
VTLNMEVEGRPRTRRLANGRHRISQVFGLAAVTKLLGKELEIESRRLEDSWSWFLDGPKFHQWCDDTESNSTLFCNGGPGVEKYF